ncbi:MAG TPA: Gfo/Idh/MocA family oxidoreductase [Candidatus Dormibacteraeota bacterium]|jgi:predicted dehydrogenase|nr:Gfo/Idh/MocA family oxidoreductase [Candidatus Dormibacteraeota bacterium]
MRLLVVGMGGCGRAWVTNALPQVPQVELAGCVDTDPRALERATSACAVPADRCFTELDAALDAVRPDAVLVATTLPGHAPVSRRALETGRHVLVEKPFAASVAEGEALVAQAAAAGLTLMVSQNYRFFPAAQAAADQVLRGELGELHEVDIDFRHFSALGEDGVPRGHQLLEQPLLEDMSIHHFDLLRMVIGAEPLQVWCRAWNPGWSWFSGPPVGLATIVFENGVEVSYRGSWLSHGPVTPWAGEWRMTFADGEVGWTSRSLLDDDSCDRVGIRSRGGEAKPVELVKGRPVDRAGSLAEFVDAVASGREPESSGRENLRSLALMHAAIGSAAQGGAALPVVGA